MNRPACGFMLLTLFASLPAALSPGCSLPDRSGELAAFASQLPGIERERDAKQVSGATGAAERPGDGSWFRLASHPARDGSAGQPAGKVEVSPTQDGGQEPSPPANEDEVDRVASTGRHRPGPLPGFWDTVQRDLRAAPGDLWQDTKAVYGSGQNLVILGLAYGGSLALQESGPNDTIEDSFRRGHRTFNDDWRDGFAAAGNPGTHFALASLWYLLGQQTRNEKTYDVGKTLFSALTINGLSTMAGQAATWDDGPNGEWGAFPSGHTSSTFTFASVMHRAYGHWVGIPLYGLGALVAYERVESEEHYFSDVVMGGVLGLVVGHSVAGEHEFELLGGRIMPYADPATGTSGIAWVKQFK
ncbi:MAG TPA: phosphatase PAP2 family protein [Phycisphaerae bacterium]|nr:phosphatase PAP2 family protein [Phycisphaerae bacterium]